MIVSSVWSYPEPREITVNLLVGKRAMMQSDARGPALAYFSSSRRCPFAGARG